MQTDPYQDLLREKGGTGFPTIMFLDADGSMLGKHSGKRTVEDFQASLERVSKFKEVLAKAAAGDAAAKREVFVQNLEWGSIPFAEAKQQAATMKDLTAEQTARIETALVTLELADARGKMRSDPAGAVAAMLAMHDGKRVPTDKMPAQNFYATLASAAEQAKDIKAFELAYGEFRRLLGDATNAERILAQFERRLAALKEQAEKK